VTKSDLRPLGLLSPLFFSFPSITWKRRFPARGPPDLVNSLPPSLTISLASRYTFSPRFPLFFPLALWGVLLVLVSMLRVLCCVCPTSQFSFLLIEFLSGCFRGFRKWFPSVIALYEYSFTMVVHVHTCSRTSPVLGVPGSFSLRSFSEAQKEQDVLRISTFL